MEDVFIVLESDKMNLKKTKIMHKAPIKLRIRARIPKNRSRLKRTSANMGQMENV